MNSPKAIILSVAGVFGALIYLKYRKEKKAWEQRANRLTKLFQQRFGGRVEIQVVQNESECIENLERLVSDNPLVIGVDAEWSSQNQKRSKVDVLQICSEKLCLVIQIHKFKQKIPQILGDLLEDPTIKKSGVAIDTDAKRLRASCGINIRGFVDLRHLLKRTTYDERSFKKNGLKALAGTLLGKNISKGQRSPQRSQWDQDVLSDEQALYAAADAYFSREIFIKLYQHRDPNFYESKSDEIDLKSMSALEINKWCLGLTDLKCKNAKPKNPDQRGKSGGKGRSQNEKSDRLRIGARAPDHPVFDNCHMYNKHGGYMGTTSKKKMDWYLGKGLATVYNEELTPGYIINFEIDESVSMTPEGVRPNICVTCGSPKDLVRHRVVPEMYRTHFPARFKDYNSHDFLVLCVYCHQKCRTEHFHNVLLVEYGVKKVSRYIDDRDKIHVMKAARALRRPTLPPQKRLELEQLVAAYLNKPPETLTGEDVTNMTKIEPRTLNSDYRDVGESIVEIIGEEGIPNFIRRWRRYFIDTMKPQHLPEYWTVEGHLGM